VPTRLGTTSYVSRGYRYTTRASTYSFYFYHAMWAEGYITVINTITSPKRAFMRQESKRAKLCVNHATQGLTLFHGLYPRQASLYPVFLSAPTWKRLPQPSQTGNKRKTLASIKLVSGFVRVH
jgi:hypothetical protein